MAYIKHKKMQFKHLIDVLHTQCTLQPICTDENFQLFSLVISLSNHAQSIINSQQAQVLTIPVSHKKEKEKKNLKGSADLNTLSQSIRSTITYQSLNTKPKFQPSLSQTNSK